MWVFLPTKPNPMNGTAPCKNTNHNCLLVGAATASSAAVFGVADVVDFKRFVACRPLYVLDGIQRRRKLSSRRERRRDDLQIRAHDVNMEMVMVMMILFQV